jgi:uncharacterized membrane protein YvlD (DUF360 family)
MARVRRRRPPRGLVLVLLVVGLVALAAGVFYFATPANKIPTWLPGRVTGKSYHHVRRATAALVVAVLCAVGAWLLARPRGTASS